LSKNVAVFVDVANIFYAAKAAGVDIDYVTMLKSATAGRDLVRAYAYTGLDPDNENQRNFHDFLRRHGYKVVSKDIRKYGDGKVKANLDIELVVDMMKTARNLDIAIIVSGDGDFAPAIRAVQEMGVRCEVISFRGNTSSDLIEVADLFTDITQIAKVEKGSSRSGRRVATDDEDLSMTEVPDKLTEGTGAGAGRGRGRRRSTESERPVAAERATGRTRARPAIVAVVDDAAAIADVRPTIVALPGEKLSRARPAPVVVEAAPVDAADEAVGAEGEESRRRRRRGGRGRGRGRGHGEGEIALEADVVATDRALAPEVDDVPVAPRISRPAAFGSVWDSQLGQGQAPSPRRDVPFDEEFDDEPAIPEYLIAERRGGMRQPGRGVGGRGVRSGYSAAVDRERFGSRGGGGLTGGINRYPDVSARTGAGGRDGGRHEVPRRDDRGTGRPARVERVDRIGGAPRPGEGWSEVPPELEAMLRAQLAAGGGDRGSRVPRDRAMGAVPASPAAMTPAAMSSSPVGSAAEPTEAAKKTRGPRRPRATTGPSAAPAVDSAPATEAAAPKVRTRRTTVASSARSTPSPEPAAIAEAAAPKRRTPRAKAEPAATMAEAAPLAAAVAPRRRASRAKATTGEA